MLWDRGSDGAHPGEMGAVDEEEEKQWEVDGEKTESEDSAEGKQSSPSSRPPLLWNQIHWLTLESSAYLEE